MRYIFLIILSSVLSVSNAAMFNHTGTISRLGTIDSRDDADFVILDGFIEAGSCPTASGLVIGRIRTGENGNKTFSLAMAAKLSGKQLLMNIDDTVKNAQGDCFIHGLEIID